MYSAIELTNAINSLASLSRVFPETSQNDLLDNQAKRLKFRDFNHFENWLHTASEKSIEKISDKLKERVCATKLPKPEESYYFFTKRINSIGYYSKFLGWDADGYEVRIPGIINADARAPEFRSILNQTIYVIDSFNEFLNWKKKWYAPAFVKKELALEFYKILFLKNHKVVFDRMNDIVRQRYKDGSPKYENDIFFEPI